MLADAPLGAFVATTDAVLARAFYEGVLGLHFRHDDGFALVFDCHGTVLRVSTVAELTTAPYTVLGWQVPDVDAAVDQLTAAGIAFEHYPFMTDDPRPIMTFPSGDRVAWFKDPDGNLLSLTQAG